MANNVAGIAINATLSENKDSGLGSVKDSVSLSGLGLSKTGGKYYHSDAAITNPQTYDLNDGSLKDAFGDAIAFATLYGLYIKNNTGGTLQIGAGTNPVDFFGTPATHTFELVDGGTFLYENPTGLTLTPGSSDDLKFAGAAGDLDIIIVGAE